MPGCTVLLVDDDRLFIMRVRKILTEAGFSVVHAYTGTDAIARVQQTRIDLAVVDIVMPGQGGYETIRQLRAGAPGLKIIITSSLGKPEYFEIGRMLGADEAIRKPAQDAPFPASEWLERIRHLIGGPEIAAAGLP